MKVYLVFLFSVIQYFFGNIVYAEPKSCEPSVNEVSNADGSIVKLLVFDCGQDALLINVLLKKKIKGNWEKVLEKSIERINSPAFGASIKDVDGDGFNDVEIIDNCGNVNCSSQIYRLDPQVLTYYHYYSGLSDFEFIDSYLVSGGRSNCCSWGYTAYKIPSDKTVIDESKIDFIIEVSYPEKAEIKGRGAKCKFLKRKNGDYHNVPPPSKNFLKFCEHYGKKYFIDNSPSQ